jgi:FO synthase
MRDNLAVHTMARVLLRIDNPQTSWVKQTISRMAGSEQGSAKTIADLEQIGIGIARQRARHRGREDRRDRA